MLVFAVFILGLCVGSFLNVVIDRLPAGQTIVAGRSYCDHCKHKLSWHDLFPVLSFLLLGGKCRYCRVGISFQYPLVELITGLLFLLAYTTMIRIIEVYSIIRLFYFLVIISGLVAIFFTDLKYRIIPDQILVLLALASLIYLFIFQKNNLPEHLLAGVILLAFFLALVLATRGRGMGLGDVKYAFVMGFILGIPYSIISFYLSFLTGALISIILVISGRKKMKGTIPFGPFLVGGTLMSLFYGQLLWGLFKKIIGL